MMDDSSLARALADDLDGHFEQLVRTYQDRLYGFALRLTDSRQDAEESTQDAFVRAYRALERYPAERRRELRLRPWLYQIALNVVRNRVRRSVPTLVALDGAVGNGLAGHADEQPEDHAGPGAGPGRACGPGGRHGCDRVPEGRLRSGAQFGIGIGQLGEQPVDIAHLLVPVAILLGGLVRHDASRAS